MEFRKFNNVEEYLFLFYVRINIRIPLILIKKEARSNIYKITFTKSGTIETKKI